MIVSIWSWYLYASNVSTPAFSASEGLSSFWETQVSGSENFIVSVSDTGRADSSCCVLTDVVDAVWNDFVLPWHRFLIRFRNLRQFRQKEVSVSVRNRSVVCRFFDCVVFAALRVLFEIVKRSYNDPLAWRRLLFAGSWQDPRKDRECPYPILEKIHCQIGETGMFCLTHIHRYGYRFVRNRIALEQHYHMFR